MSPTAPSDSRRAGWRAPAQTAETVEFSSEDPLDEGQWQLFAQAGAAAGVRSTLSLPIMDGDRVTAGVNLYGAQPGTFDGRQEQLAQLFGAWAPGAVANADLSFDTRLQAARAPARLQDLETVDQAVGMLMARHRIGAQHVRRRLEEAVARAGVPVVAVARAVHTGDHFA
ncbi:GAF domain-containing protein [Terrabacter terrae]|uniref:GAF domain-containing protein n=1 Tax=Terrabacter terrae TaxID=318434 RepID=UPI0031D58E2A